MRRKARRLIRGHGYARLLAEFSGVSFAPVDPVLHLSGEKAFLDLESEMEITGLRTRVAMECLIWM